MKKLCVLLFKGLRRVIRHPIIVLIAELFALPVLVVAALFARYKKKKIAVGLGPSPLINNIYHKKALEKQGYQAETFVNQVYFITDAFDVRGDLIIRNNFLRSLYLFLHAIFRYECLYLYFTGGPLGRRIVLKYLEPWLLRLAGVRTVVTAFGGDVQDLSRCPNLLYTHYIAQDYPDYRLRRHYIDRCIDRWTKHASHIIGGCDWVYYLYYWDTLMLAHFSIDLADFPLQNSTSIKQKPLTILHAPNHRAIKGTDFFIKAVRELQEEGYDIQLNLIEKVSNEEVKQAIREADIVADQLIIGWYAMFALEAMASEKPVLCYLRPDLIELFTVAGLVEENEIPLVHCTPLTVKERIRYLAENREQLSEIGKRSRRFVEKHHSLEHVGSVFDTINRKIGITNKKGG